MFDTFNFDEASNESADKIDDATAKFEPRCLPERMKRMNDTSSTKESKNQEKVSTSIAQH